MDNLIDFQRFDHHPDNLDEQCGSTAVMVRDNLL